MRGNEQKVTEETKGEAEMRSFQDREEFGAADEHGCHGSVREGQSGQAFRKPEARHVSFVHKQWEKDKMTASLKKHLLKLLK